MKIKHNIMLINGDLLIEEEEITLKSGDIRKITIRSTCRGHY